MSPLGSLTHFVTNRDRCQFQRLLRPLQFLHYIGNVGATDDRVPLEDGASSLPADLHEDAFCDSGAAKVPC